MARRKTLKYMTLEEAWKVVDAKYACKVCGDCFASKETWKVDDGETCNDILKHALSIIKETFNSLGTAYRDAILNEGAESQSSTEPFYQQTKDFMKKSGYTKCYMCGAELK